MVFFLFFGWRGRGGGVGVVGGCGVGRGWWMRVVKEGEWGVRMLKFKNGNGKRCVYGGCGSLPSLSRGVPLLPSFPAVWHSRVIFVF